MPPVPQQARGACSHGDRVPEQQDKGKLQVVLRPELRTCAVSLTQQSPACLHSGTEGIPVGGGPTEHSGHFCNPWFLKLCDLLLFDLLLYYSHFPLLMKRLPDITFTVYIVISR